MRSSTVRDILFLDVLIDSDPGYAPGKTMTAILDYIEELYKDKDQATALWTAKKSKKIYIREFQRDAKEQTATLLLYIGDKDRGGASFTNLETDEQTDFPLQDGEGRPDSAHLIIWEEAAAAHQLRYRALLEVSPGLPRVIVQSYLNHLVRLARKKHPDHFRFPSLDGAKKRDGTPVMERYTVRLYLQGHLSKEFADDIANGKLSGIHLETFDNTKFGFGDGAYVKPGKQQISLTPVQSWTQAAMNAVKEAFDLAKANKYEQTRISFSTGDKMSHTAVFDSATGNVLNDGYIKKVRISNLLLPEASKTIEADFVAIMKNAAAED